MPVFEENPDQFSKSRLKTELIAHNITLPSTESKKEVYLELYLKHISHKTVADFSSDEEDDLAPDVVEETTEASDMLDLIGLTDDDLKAALLKHGVKTGPIVATTRALYERKLKKILLPASQPDLNGRGDAGQYSDSDEGEEQAEEDDTDSEQAEPETALKLDQDQQEISQVWLHPQNDGDIFYPQCFVPSRLWAREGSLHRKSNPRRNAGNVMNTSDKSDHRLLTRSGLSRTSSVGQLSESGVYRLQPVSLLDKHRNVSPSSQIFSITQMVEAQLEGRRSLSSKAVMGRVLSGSDLQEPKSKAYRQGPLLLVDKFTMTNRSLNMTSSVSSYKPQSKEPAVDVLKMMFPNTVTPPTGISATRRMPIKGAAERPIKFKYPDIPKTPVSPAILESRWVERRLVPLWVQILVFLVIACLLYFIYASMEACLDSPFLSVIEKLSVGSEGEEALPFQPEPQDTPILGSPTD